MVKYIELDGVLDLLTNRDVVINPNDEVAFIRKDVECLPGVDIVFCKNCKYWKPSKIEPSFHVCTYVFGATFVRKAEDFCSRGLEREEG